MENIVAAFAHITDALDPGKWLPNDFENQDEGLYFCHYEPVQTFSSDECAAKGFMLHYISYYSAYSKALYQSKND